MKLRIAMMCFVIGLLVVDTVLLLGCRDSPEKPCPSQKADRAAWVTRHVHDPNCPKLDECYWYPDHQTRTPMGPTQSKWMTDIQWESYQKNSWPIFQNAIHADVEETVDGAELVITIRDIEGRTASLWAKS